MLDVTIAGWAATIGLIAALFALDLFVSRPGHAHVIGFREATIASLFFISVAIGFGVVFGLIAGWDFGAEYFAGYIVEKSLSVDNLFVFLVVFRTLGIPHDSQRAVLSWGLFGALVFRLAFIFVGVAAVAGGPHRPVPGELGRAHREGPAGGVVTQPDPALADEAVCRGLDREDQTPHLHASRQAR